MVSVHRVIALLLLAGCGPAPLGDAPVVMELRLDNPQRLPVTVDVVDGDGCRQVASPGSAAHLRLELLAATSDPTAVARAAITRVLASHGAGPAARSASMAAAQQATAAAWRSDQARLTAARIELAEAESGPEAATAMWQAALAGLDARAEGPVQQWLRRRCESAK